MNALTLILVVFFSIYNGLGSKITNEKIIEIGERIDNFFKKLIEYFIEKNNEDLFPILKKYNQKLASYLFITTIIFSLFEFKVSIIITSSFFIVLFMCVPLLSPKEFKKAFEKNMTQLSVVLILFIGFCFFYNYLEAYFPIKYQNLNNLIKALFARELERTGLSLFSFSSILLALLFLAIGSIFFFHRVGRLFLWYLLVPLFRMYSKCCKWLNEEQPLKPFYLLSKTIIVFATYFLTY